MDEIINEIITAFSALWHVRRVGNSYEIITPVPTSNDMFVSVFLTKRENEYVVTDAGWIDSGVYDIDEIGDSVYKKITAYYTENYPQIAVERGSVDEVITMMIKGEVL